MWFNTKRDREWERNIIWRSGSLELWQYQIICTRLITTWVCFKAPFFLWIMKKKIIKKIKDEVTVGLFIYYKVIQWSYIEKLNRIKMKVGFPTFEFNIPIIVRIDRIKSTKYAQLEIRRLCVNSSFSLPLRWLTVIFFIDMSLFC